MSHGSRLQVCQSGMIPQWPDTHLGSEWQEGAGRRSGMVMEHVDGISDWQVASLLDTH